MVVSLSFILSFNVSHTFNLSLWVWNFVLYYERPRFPMVQRIINIHTVWLILMFRADTECDVEKGIYANLSTTYVIKVYIFTSCRRRFGYSFQTNHRTCDSRPARKFRGCFVRPHRVRYISFFCLSNRMFSHVWIFNFFLFTLWHVKLGNKSYFLYILENYLQCFFFQKYNFCNEILHV